MPQLKAFLFLIRFPNLFIIALTQFLLGFFVLKIPFDYTFFALVSSTILIAAGGNIINDYFDVRFDHINKPKEIWVGKYFSRRTILGMHLVISGLGVIIGASTSYYVGLFDAFCVALLWLYSQKLKCIPFLGNLVVAFLTSFVILVFALKFKYFENSIWLLVYFSFLINWIREITKDIEDIQGDKAFECKTIATQYGVVYSKKIVLVLQLVLLTSFITLAVFTPLTFKIYIIFVLIPTSSILLYKTWNAHQKSDFKLLSRIEKLLILLGVLSLLLLML